MKLYMLCGKWLIYISTQFFLSDPKSIMSGLPGQVNTITIFGVLHVPRYETHPIGAYIHHFFVGIYVLCFQVLLQELDFILQFCYHKTFGVWFQTVFFASPKTFGEFIIPNLTITAFIKQAVIKKHQLATLFIYIYIYTCLYNIYIYMFIVFHQSYWKPLISPSDLLVGTLPKICESVQAYLLETTTLKRQDGAL